MDKRLIINEVQRQFPTSNDFNIESLLRVSPTLRNLLGVELTSTGLIRARTDEQTAGNIIITTAGTFTVPEFLTPTLINQVVSEIVAAQLTILTFCLRYLK